MYATSKFDVGKKNSPFHLPLRIDAVLKKQRASKVPKNTEEQQKYTKEQQISKYTEERQNFLSMFIFNTLREHKNNLNN